LLFSDIPNNKIHRYDPADGSVSLFRDHPGAPNGLALDAERRLIICEQGNRKLTRISSSGRVEVLADSYEGKPLNSPNDLDITSDGSIYFTDPPFGINLSQQEQPYNGVYRLTPDGVLSRLINDFQRPNGIVFASDYMKVYLIDTARKHVKVYDVLSDGSFVNGKVFAEIASKRFGIPDGMDVDDQGNVFIGGEGGIWVISPDGRHLGTVPTEQSAVNFVWGDDGKSLYVTAHSVVYRLRTTTGRS
jgi:gluconolactonase